MKAKFFCTKCKSKIKTKDIKGYLYMDGRYDLYATCKNCGNYLVNSASLVVDTRKEIEVRGIIDPLFLKALKQT